MQVELTEITRMLKTLDHVIPNLFRNHPVIPN